MREPIPRKLGLTRESALVYLGYDCRAEWLEPYGRWGAMEGHMVKVDADGYLCVDYGYGIPVEIITKIDIIGTHEDR